MIGRTRNTRIELMNMLISAYEKTKDESKWSKAMDMSSVYPHTRPTFYNHLQRTVDLWEKKKKGTVVLLRPIQDWANYVEKNDEYLNENTINLMCDTIMHIENIHEKVVRLYELLDLIELVGGSVEYKGMYSDMNKRLKILKKDINERVK